MPPASTSEKATRPGDAAGRVSGSGSPHAARETPAMRQYFRFKRAHPDAILFFRMGDFYEMFDDDAVVAHRALNITLTERTAGMPMAGVPHHSAGSYIRRLLGVGHKVAICEQVQDPKEARGVVERAVTRVLTPGTLVDDDLLAGDRSNHLAAVCFLESGQDAEARVALAIVELSTGAFTVSDCPARRAVDELARISAQEVLFAETGDLRTPPRVQAMLDALGATGTPRPGWHFRAQEARESLCAQFGVSTLAGFGLSDDDPTIGAAGAIVRYVRETQGGASGDEPEAGAASSGALVDLASLTHLSPPRRDRPEAYVAIDAASLRSLEIERTIRAEQAEGSLLGVFSGPGGCRTPMGRRLLRDWLCRPLADRAGVEARHRCVATLVEDVRTHKALTGALDEVQDVARIAGRLGLARATPRDLVALGRSLARLDEIGAALANAPAFESHATRLEDVRTDLAPLGERIERSCVDDAPPHLREGGLFRDGVDAALDEARSIGRDAATWLGEHQRRLIEEHDLPSLKVGYNKVFGYYIELPSAQARRAPASFTRKQTLKNAERYITPELKEFEEKATTAESRAIEREQALFRSLCEGAAALAPTIAAFAQVVAELDALRCFADRSARLGWTRPEMLDEPILDLRDARHPVLETLLRDEYVPNDVRLGVAAGAGSEGGASLALITGPNMAGKSTYIRTAALLTLLAQAGSFVPAASARIGVVDAVFTRIGADDALHRGQSTFMVEMTETANILHNATARSLVVLDEIGRGTSTLDGLSLAWAIAESLAGGLSGDVDDEGAPRCVSPRTLFATHYHELTDLEERLPGRVTNLRVLVKEIGEEIVFLHRVAPGRADQSYGVQVARLAGMPPIVVERAGELLRTLSVSHTAAEAAASPAPPLADPQMPLFAPPTHPVIEALRGTDLNALSPLEAFDLLREWKREVDGSLEPSARSPRSG